MKQTIIHVGLDVDDTLPRRVMPAAWVSTAVGKTGEFSAGSVATRAEFNTTHWQSGASFADCSG